MKKTEITRRGLIGASVIGAAGLLLPKGIAYASEPELIRVDGGLGEIFVGPDDDYRETAIATSVGCIITGDEEVDKNNREAFRLWNDAVKKAVAEGSEIVTVVNQDQREARTEELSTRTIKTAYTQSKRYTSGAFLSFDYQLKGEYDVTSSKVSGWNKNNHKTVLLYSLYNGTISVNSHSFTTIDSGRTYAVHSTLYAKATVAGVTTAQLLQVYSEFYNNHKGTIY